MSKTSSIFFINYHFIIYLFYSLGEFHNYTPVVLLGLMYGNCTNKNFFIFIVALVTCDKPFSPKKLINRQNNRFRQDKDRTHCVPY